jgi:hypothetical protein
MVALSELRRMNASFERKILLIIFGTTKAIRVWKTW